MAISSDAGFHLEAAESRDAQNMRLTTVICHGRLVSESTDALREQVKPIIERGGRIVVDCRDLSYVDSSGLGALVGLKVSAVNKGHCTLELVNVSDRVKELLRITKLTQFLSR